jgi:hypothetical protein
MFTVLFWRDAAERAIATAAQTGVGLLVVDSVTVGLLDVDWPGGLAVVGSAALASLLKALAATRFGDRESASLSPSVGITDARPRS